MVNSSLVSLVAGAWRGQRPDARNWTGEAEEKLVVFVGEPVLRLGVFRGFDEETCNFGFWGCVFSGGSQEET